MEVSLKTDQKDLQRFYSNKISREVDSILYAYLYNISKYEPVKITSLCHMLCKLILQRCQEIMVCDDLMMKRKGIKPIKFLVDVVIGQDKGQGFYMTCGGESDNSYERIECTYRNKVIFVVVVVNALM